MGEGGEEEEECEEQEERRREEVGANLYYTKTSAASHVSPGMLYL